MEPCHPGVFHRIVRPRGRSITEGQRASLRGEPVLEDNVTEKFGVTLVVLMLLASSSLLAQQSTPAIDHPWIPPVKFRAEQGKVSRQSSTVIDPHRIYALPDLIDLAEMHSPSTRAAWDNARATAARLGEARGDLLPQLTAVALANTSRDGVLLGDSFVRQTIGLYEPMLQVSYLAFDFGGRFARIDQARERLVGANLNFNRSLLDLLFETSRRYYQLLNAQGQQEAAQLNFNNAETVRKAVEARLAVGLATLPDALEARAASAQDYFTLQSVIGDVDVRRGDLLTLLGAAPTEALQVKPLGDLPTPDHFDLDVHTATEHSLQSRPELGEQIAARDGAHAEIRAARSAFLPTLDFQGQGGEGRLYGRQNQLNDTYAGPVEEWNVNLNLRWELFDGGRRKSRLDEAHAEEKQAEAQIEETRDQIEQQVWTAYIGVRTAFYQRDASAALVAASKVSYEAALKSYQYGLRNTVDVVSAQRTLAQALSNDVAARTNLLTQLAGFAYRTGDLLQEASKKAHP